MNSAPTGVPTRQAMDGGGLFSATHWSVVVAAGNSASPQAQAALETLCRTYWRPLYAYVRSRGWSVEDAQDLTQEFFSRLLQRQDLGRLDPQKGRFRSFLLAAMVHFLANEHDRITAQKRGGGRIHLSWFDLKAEDLASIEAGCGDNPEQEYQRQWALTLLEQTLARLRQECAQAGKSQVFDALKHFLTGRETGLAYADLAGLLNMSEGAIRVATHRLRQRFAELLREEIAATVGSAAEVEAELSCLFSALSV